LQLFIIWIVLLVGAFYLLLWRPQQRRMAAARSLQSDLHEGDNVLTTSGIYGRITRLGVDDADLEIAPGTVIHIARGAVGQRLDPEPSDNHDDEHEETESE
jgi:preprotein translocase subunit YajC